MDTDRRTWLGRLIAGVTLLFARCAPAPAHNPPREPRVPDLRSDFAKQADAIRDILAAGTLTRDQALYIHDLIDVYTPAEASREATVDRLVNSFRGLTMTVAEVDHAHYLIDACIPDNPGRPGDAPGWNATLSWRSCGCLTNTVCQFADSAYRPTNSTPTSHSLTVVVVRASWATTATSTGKSSVWKL